MDKLLDRILFKQDEKRFDKIRTIAGGFANEYIGDNIIREGVFSVIENYARTKEIPLEWIRIPIDDNELCACTFVRGGRIFVMINTTIPVSKQIFAAAHELYHIWCYLENDNDGLENSGSILQMDTIEEGATELEEMKANAFAGALLAPAKNIKQQIDIYRIDRNNIEMDDVLALVDVFAIPYKAMVLRLMEESVIIEDKAKKLMAISSDEVTERMDIIGKGKRWNLAPSGNESLGSVVENIKYNTENENLPLSRLESDNEILERIKKRYGIQ